jgi:hypothetical protein
MFFSSQSIHLSFLWPVLGLDSRGLRNQLEIFEGFNEPWGCTLPRYVKLSPPLQELKRSKMVLIPSMPPFSGQLDFVTFTPAAILIG